MKIFDFENPEQIKDGAVAIETDENHNPINRHHKSQTKKKQK